MNGGSMTEAQSVESEQPVKETDRLHADSNMDKVVRLLNENYHRPVTLSEAARLACLSPKYLSRIFKEKTGKNFTQVRMEVRVAQSKRLLTHSAYDVNQIAHRVGYENAESFMKIFKKLVGTTPSKYRRLHQPKT